MAEQNLDQTSMAGIAGAMQGMELVQGSMGRVEPVYATKPTMAARELPEDWGGRPVGTSRRAIRMQAEWDKQREALLGEQQTMQQMELQRRQMALQERDQFIQDSEYNRKIKEYEAQQDIQGQAEVESNNILDWLGGRAVDASGNPIPKPNPQSAEFQSELLGRMADNPLGAELNKGIIDQYIGANKTYMDAQQTKQEKEAQKLSQETQAKVGLARDLASVGRSISEFTEDGKINFESANVALGEAMKAGEEQKIVRAEEREEKRNINSQISKLETDVVKIRGEVGRYQKRLEAKKDAATQKELDAALVEQGILEDELNRLNRLRGGEESATEQQQATEQQPQAEQPQKELSQRDQSALNWANANPDDPRSQRIKDKLGVQ